MIHATDSVGDAVRGVLDSGLPALPVVDDDERSSGSSASASSSARVFPGYLKELKYAGFVKRSLEDALEKRSRVPRRTGARRT